MPASPDLPGFLERHRQSMRFAGAFDGCADWPGRARALMLAALPPCDGPAVRVRDGRWRFATGAEAGGVFLRPDTEPPHPAILLLHDHGGSFDAGWRKMFDPRPDPDRHYGGRALGPWLLSQGYAVLCLDALGWGARQAGGYEGQQALAANAMQLGWSIAGLVAAEDLQAARWLAGQPGISGVGALGFSFGGFRAWQVAALAPEIRACVSISWMARRCGLMAPGAPLLRGQSAFYMLHPSLSGLMDFPDMAGAGAGKPAFFRSGRDDPHMPQAAVTEAYADLRRIWGPDHARLDTGFFDGGHQFGLEKQDEAERFLRRALSGPGCSR